LTGKEDAFYSVKDYDDDFQTVIIDSQ
jgi:hypothetical protein